MFGMSFSLPSQASRQQANHFHLYERFAGLHFTLIERVWQWAMILEGIPPRDAAVPAALACSRTSAMSVADIAG